MNRQCIGAGFAVLWVTSALLAAPDPQAESMFNDLFGKEYRQVRSTRSIDDDLALSQRMLALAPQVADHAGLCDILCQRIFELSHKHTDGIETAQASQELLIEKVPARKGQALNNLVLLHQHLYNTARGESRKAIAEKLITARMDAADWAQEQEELDLAVQHLRAAQGLANVLRSHQRELIAARFNELALMQRRQQKADQLNAHLERHPDDQKASRELVMLYLVEMDKPAKAGLYTLPLNDPKLQGQIALACKVADMLTEAELMQLSDWYLQLAEQAPPDAKLLMYQRTADYLERFLAAHPDEDVNRLKADLRLKQVNQQIEKYSPKMSKPKWVDGAIVALTFEEGSFSKVEWRWFVKNLLGDEPLPEIHHIHGDDGMFKRAAKFDGEQSFINLNMLASEKYLTFNFWARGEPKGHSQMLFGLYREDKRLYIAYNPSGRLNVGHTTSKWDVSPSDISLDDQWHMYTLVRDGRGATLYYDGKKILTKPGAAKPEVRLFLGAGNQTSENEAKNHFKGLIDEFAAWDRPLSDREITDLYRYSKAGKSYCDILVKFNK